MNSLKLFLLFGSAIFFLSALHLADGKNWAVILVGLNYYGYTYGYEAMAYKQYHDLVKGGIPKENIIIISPDSAAYHPYNAIPGLVAYAYDKEDFSADAPVNQYEDIEVDYSRVDFTLKLFFDVLEGKSSANLSSIGSGRVIKSGPQDNIYLYIHTLGYEGFFLLNNRNLLYTDKFIPFLEELSEKKAFKKMFIHMHASYTGSMFDDYMDLDKKIMVYSMGGRYNEFTMCHKNVYLSAYTSSCQQFAHFNYLDKALSKNGAKETVLDVLHGSGLTNLDAEIVQNLYGDFSLAKNKIKEFLGSKLKNSQSLTAEEMMEIRKENEKHTKKGKSMMKLLFEDENIPLEEKQQIETNMEKIVSESIKNTKIPRNLITGNDRAPRLPFKKFDCYRNSITEIREKCFTEKSQFLFLKYASRLLKLCSMDVPSEKILGAIRSSC